ncbi:LysM peptidoglycan-binding domain-containing protein [Sphingobacterium sp. T2]|uniref:LysM peptidoglycan-binding domain-containing protein n=1 Tax=Sphingobacterium sp. T2 TaxID=1590596 RepID=UPI00057B9DC5|nr:LysM peptidoglycan-binding domain-containing protein [Sphingobacterium sp. T2]
MEQKSIIKSYQKLSFLFFFGLTLSATSPAKAAELDHNIIIASAPDSIGTETVNGKSYVIHKLAPKETYYQLSRIYGVAVKDIMEANNKKNLRVGDTVRIPRGNALIADNRSNVTSKKDEQVILNPEDITEYKVGKNETLYAISRRFSISVEDIKKVNNMTNNNVREGQILKIPNKSLPKPAPVIPIPPVIESTQGENETAEEFAVRTNKYGIRETREKGIGVWMEDLENDEHTSLALHKTAPVGTILKITNPMNRSVTFAKVVGKFTDNHETHGAIVIISKSVASSIGILDKRFQIEITYGAPLNIN